MTEEEWFAALEPNPVHDWAHPFKVLEGLRQLMSDRKLRLFMVACCRHINSHLWATRPTCEQAVSLAERYADGLATEAELDGMKQKMEVECADNQGDPVRDASWNLCLPTVAEVVSSFALDSAKTPHLMYDVHDQSEQLYRQMIVGSLDQLALMEDIFGNPFRPVAADPQWLTSTVSQLAQGIYDDRAFDRLPILADALQDAGCENADVLNHCRDNGPHARGCWVVDLVLGKA